MARSEVAARAGTRRTRAHSAWADRNVFGTPARFMAPRLVFLAMVVLLVLFGITMIYSSSSITALTSQDSNYNPAFYLQRQLLFAAVGTVCAVVLARLDYHLWTRRPLMGVVVAATIVFLVLALTPWAGSDALGASRWLAIGPFTLQPSEFAKISVILVAAALIADYYETGEHTSRELVWAFVLGVLVPAGLVFVQPDKGTVTVVAATLVLMLYFGGARGRLCLALLALGVVGIMVVSLVQPYSRARILTALNPWSDPYGAGYQLIQGFYAFGSGGVLGVGIGMSKQKYSYLPMAYNDFIYAVVGEELGLVGTLGMLAAFVALLWAGFRIARYAPDLAGRLVAVGCTSILVIQMLLNVSGVVGVFPLSGKPIPFVSYGGSSIMSSLMLAGLVMSVSLRSRLPRTEYESRRGDWSVTSAPRARDRASDVGEPTPRSARDSSWGTADRAAGPSVPLASGRRFQVIGGGRAEDGEGRPQSPTSPEALRREREMRERTNGARVTSDSRGRRRIDLGPSPSERLRSRDTGPQVRGVDSARGGRGERRGR